jgi:hypothetical protein
MDEYIYMTQGNANGEMNKATFLYKMAIPSIHPS